MKEKTLSEKKKRNWIIDYQRAIWTFSLPVLLIGHSILLSIDDDILFILPLILAILIKFIDYRIFGE